MKIILAGGGSGGSVSPLLAVSEALKNLRKDVEFVFIGGRVGPEKLLVESENIKFYSIDAGRLRRYFSFYNLLTPFLVLAGFIESRRILKTEKPDLVFGAGSFVQVPVVIAAWSLSIPVVLHQQDLWPSLANKLCQFFASKISVTFRNSLTDFKTGSGFFYKKPENKVVLTGNPFRARMLAVSKTEGTKFFGLKNDLPVLLVLGGGTGAEAINKVVIQALPELTKFIQVLHVAGKGKSVGSELINYVPLNFTLNMGEAYAAADIVISRAGLSTITELSNLKKVAVLVPMPKSHQEINALLMAEMDAAVVVPESKLIPEFLVRLVRKVLFDYEVQKKLSLNMEKVMPRDAAEKIAKIILELLNGNK
ncbi:MAG: UDP-N-acetylglucosamine--N-acetylmuramyl-(pentapeptide) pyrophosphoryl-undecaprenol N-acetylglucosamine transferase [Candidatus Doudnabacteria bacterium]|nr:UDP-N-acetylglucosamine--N-acetylmuramyl-(pentapeptide) pyrophosphoryl-undecaprenol N-acetylglucosamine transferase [Candidatus Doudnabacteria bacterium]